MSSLFGVPVKGQVGPDSFQPHIAPQKIDNDLIVEWRSYLTDCLENNFAVNATIEVSANGGTVLWISKEHRLDLDAISATVKQDLLMEFAQECLRDFLKRRLVQ